MFLSLSETVKRRWRKISLFYASLPLSYVSLHLSLPPSLSLSPPFFYVSLSLSETVKCLSSVSLAPSLPLSSSLLFFISLCETVKWRRRRISLSLSFSLSSLSLSETVKCLSSVSLAPSLPLSSSFIFHLSL
ncbi:hypothetical protein NL108_016778 [Boleophthalmus pectinirostris]|nr:hypothetical protein NL108_016778 [Boleophthalmus pectinirostris]